MTNTVERIVSECKSLALMEEDLRKEVQGLKSQLMIEEQGLDMLRQSKDSLIMQTAHLEHLTQSNKDQVEYLKGLREDLVKACLMQEIFGKVIANNPPNEQLQTQEFNRLQEEYKKLLDHYESSEVYKLILQAQMEDRKLSETIADFHNKIMKLETEKEY